MPDVEVRYMPRMLNTGTGEFGFARNPITVVNFLELLCEEVAKSMDCLDDNGQQIVHDPYLQIAVPVFEPIAGKSRRSLLISVIAYDWPDRMFNIEERLGCIGERMRKACGLAEGNVAVTFHPLPRGPYPGGCWVSV